MPVLLLCLLLAVDPVPAPASSIVIPPPGEPGEALILSGIIYAEDGRTPIAGALLRVYHADARGLYNAEGATAGGGGANARLRGTMRTDAAGRYEFRTIRPASYPGTRILAHIHASIEVPGGAERPIEDYHFAGDPFLPEGAAERAGRLGRFASIVTLSKGDDGVWRGHRDIRIESGS